MTKRVVVFGASGAVGREVLRAAREAGYEVVAVVRDRSKLTDSDVAAVTVVQADLADAAALDAALAGAYGVISALGPTANSSDEAKRYGASIQAVVEAVERSGVRRFVALSGAAVNLRRERKGIPAGLASFFVRLAVRHVVRAKQHELALLQASRLEWVAPRPPRVVEGAATGRTRIGLTVRLGPRARITTGDLADALVDQVSDTRFVGRAPFVTG